MSDKLSKLSAGMIAGLGVTALPNIEAARIWSNQIRAAYALLYPLIAKDFRHILDCNECHTLSSMSYEGDGHGKKCHHSKKPIAKSTNARMLIQYGSGPFGVNREDAATLKGAGFTLFGRELDKMSGA